uniref:Anthranilate synthase component 2 n=1 Tax=Gronococcus sybilensis TaxID=3028029 RepID=A0A9Y1I2H9_9RHOD|nr:anthranilate synthase component 2 [Gronococcus sybilensis]
MKTESIIIIDNYDSFTYNLLQYVSEQCYNTYVYRNDKITMPQLKRLNPKKIILSPGPGNPVNSGICTTVVKEFGSIVPILGVCLGHQAIGYVYGAKVVFCSHLLHGKTSNIFHNKDPIFKDIENPFIATRYHSLILDHITTSSKLKIIAYTKDNTIMACRHKYYPCVYGIQFHPESILTHVGKQIIINFLQM